jgi:outer membrane protein OmpA-like peptidoglycan-associated protein
MTPARKLLAAALLLAFASFLPALAQDASGSKDSPHISRYPGSHITNYATHDFDQFQLPVGAVTPKGEPKFQTIEGRITRIVYADPAGRSSLEVYRNYESALKSAGFDPIYVCKADACGLSRFHSTSDWAVTWYGAGHYQFSGKVSRADGDIYVSLHVTPDETYLDLIQAKPMESGLVQAADLRNGIGKSGHIAVYGIHFDTARADLKPDSAATLQEISSMLKADPALKLYVVGHSDNVGAAPANLDLSRRRAAAVVQALTTQYGIAPNRLEAFGAGPYAPVAANDSDAGRALNRRVELVHQ